MRSTRDSDPSLVMVPTVLWRLHVINMHSESIKASRKTCDPKVPTLAHPSLGLCIRASRHPCAGIRLLLPSQFPSTSAPLVAPVGLKYYCVTRPGYQPFLTPCALEAAPRTSILHRYISQWTIQVFLALLLPLKKTASNDGPTKCLLNRHLHLQCFGIQ